MSNWKKIITAGSNGTHPDAADIVTGNLQSDYVIKVTTDAGGGMVLGTHSLGDIVASEPLLTLNYFNNFIPLKANHHYHLLPKQGPHGNEYEEILPTEGNSNAKKKPFTVTSTVIYNNFDKENSFSNYSDAQAHIPLNKNQTFEKWDAYYLSEVRCNLTLRKFTPGVQSNGVFTEDGQAKILIYFSRVGLDNTSNSPSNAAWSETAKTNITYPNKKSRIFIDNVTTSEDTGFVTSFGYSENSDSIWTTSNGEIVLMTFPDSPNFAVDDIISIENTLNEVEYLKVVTVSAYFAIVERGQWGSESPITPVGEGVPIYKHTIRTDDLVAGETYSGFTYNESEHTNPVVYMADSGLNFATTTEYAKSYNFKWTHAESTDDTYYHENARDYYNSEDFFPADDFPSGQQPFLPIGTGGMPTIQTGVGSWYLDKLTNFYTPSIYVYEIIGDPILTCNWEFELKPQSYAL